MRLGEKRFQMKELGYLSNMELKLKRQIDKFWDMEGQMGFILNVLASTPNLSARSSSSFLLSSDISSLAFGTSGTSSAGVDLVGDATGELLPLAISMLHSVRVERLLFFGGDAWARLCSRAARSAFSWSGESDGRISRLAQSGSARSS